METESKVSEVVEEQPQIRIYIAGKQHIQYVEEILDVIEESSKARGTGIARRSPEYVSQKMIEGKAIIALCGDDFAGFCYIESWSNKTYVVNSGLIVKPKYRGYGLAHRIKRFSFAYSRRLFPEAKLFGITSGAAVLKINNELGYRPVTFEQLTDDPAFWRGCATCVNYDVLQRTDFKRCICTAMLYDPAEHPNEVLEDLDKI
ncbi:MAG: GNAT family N-acetyltransferase [Bacteroidales bacterium]|nr:GNAT family N-acetyltransferase [Bacteroidales bacterium]